MLEFFKTGGCSDSKRMTTDSRTKSYYYVARLAIFLFIASAVNGDVCQTYAGGAVYPRETGKSSGHSLQWTKAMSILLLHL
jgi:hypothetical protein